MKTTRWIQTTNRELAYYLAKRYQMKKARRRDFVTIPV